MDLLLKKARQFFLFFYKKIKLLFIRLVASLLDPHPPPKKKNTNAYNLSTRVIWPVNIILLLTAHAQKPLINVYVAVSNKPRGLKLGLNLHLYLSRDM